MMVQQGQVLDDRYEIDTLIGQGGMSYVYRANDRKMGREVAVKVLKEEYCEDEEFILKFQNEAQAAAKLNHPNIVGVYDIVDNAETRLHYIVMELVEGITLKNYIKRAGHMDSKETIAIALQAAAGIELAHKMGIVHRDIKPQNIIVDSEGNVKVADFGIARAATQQTVNATVMGSVHYISPEQARSGKSDERSDIYSFGCTMYEMLTGKVPYDGDTSVSVVFAHMENPIPHVKDLVPEVYPALDMAVAKCMQKKARLRYQHIGELMEDLRKALKDPSGSYMTGKAEDLDETRVLSPKELAILKHKQEQHHRKEKEKSEEAPSAEFPEEETGSSMRLLYRGITGACLLLIAVLIIVIGRNMFSFFKESRTALETTSSAEETAIAEESKEISITISALDSLLPDIIGKTVEDAEESLHAYNIQFRTESEEFSDRYSEKGQIISYEDGRYQAGSTINVTVSKGPETLVFYTDAKDLTELQQTSCRELMSELEERRITYRVQDAYSEEVPAGNVISTNKPDSSGEKLLVIVRSLGSAAEAGYCIVPDLRGYTEEAALTKLEDAGLLLDSTLYTTDESAAEDTVTDQSLTPGSLVPADTSIQLTVSNGTGTSTVRKDTSAAEADAWYSSINTALKIGTEQSPGSTGTVVIQIRLCQEIDGAQRYTILQDARSYAVGTELQVVIPSIKGAVGVSKGTVEVVDATTDTVLSSYELDFAPRNS